MNRRQPELHLHSTGNWYAKWGAKFHYFGRDEQAARAAWLTDQVHGLPGWAAWRADRDTRRFPPIRSTMSLVDVSERFLEFKQLEGGDDVYGYYTRHLKRFLHAYGAARADMIRPAHVQAIKEDMLRASYAPKTVNHDVQSIRTMLAWASGMDYMPLLNLRVVRLIPLGPPPDRSMTRAQVRSMVRRAPKDVAAWLAVNYLCLMRPSEVIRVVHDQGEWVAPGVYRIRSKVERRTRMPRHVIVSPAAKRWLKKCPRRWTRLDSYSQAVRDACGPGGPQPLRHSAATHLIQSGVDRASVDLLLGHLPSRVSLTYAPIVWSDLVPKAARLKL